MSRRLEVRHVISGLAAFAAAAVVSAAVAVGPAYAQDSSTTTSSPTSATIALGASNTDTATVTVGDPTAPSGTVSFYACGPETSATGCDPTGLTAFDTENLNGSSPGAATSAAYTPAALGIWCFAAVYSGDGDYDGSSDTSSDECFNVLSSSSTTSTPATSTIDFGASNTDSASVTGSISADPTGTVSFYECGPEASATGCTPSGMPFDTETLPGDTNPASMTSASFTPSATGTWCFAAVYSGDGNYAGSSDTSSDECFTVTTSSSTTSTTSSSSIILGAANVDNALVKGNESADPTGTVTFYECGPTSSAQPCTTGTSFDTEDLPGGANPASVNSVAFTPTGTGEWCFAAVYSGDTNYATSSDTTTDECFSVTAAKPTVTSAPATKRIAVGSSDTDTVTLTGNEAGGAPTGTVTFYECGPTTAPAPCTSKLNKVGSGPVSLTPGANDQSTATSGPLTVAQGNPGYFCFRVDYSGSTQYTTASDTSTTECFDAINPPEITSFNPRTGKIGILITIKGSDLGMATLVKIGNVKQTPTLDKSDEIQIKVAKGTKTGAISVTTIGGTTTTTKKFTVT